MEKGKGDPAAIDVSLHMLLCQTARSYIGHPTPNVSVPRITTRAVAIKRAAEAAEHDSTLIALTKNPPSESMKSTLRQMALSYREMAMAPITTSANRVRSTISSPLALPTSRPRTAARKEAMRKMAQEALKINRDPYVTIRATATEGVLISLPDAFLELCGIDSGPEDPIALVKSPNTYWDTGCHVSCISDDLVDDSFLRYARGPENTAYALGEGSDIIVQVNSILRFTNSDLEISFIARIVPRERFPNGLSGILLGQLGLINFLQYQSIPKVFLRLKGEQVEDGIWGDLVLQWYFDPGTEEAVEH